MRFICLVAVGAMTLTGNATYADQVPTPIMSHGETTVVARTGNLDVKVTIKTHEVPIGKPSDGRPAVIESSCTYSKYPCSVIDRVDIRVNGIAIFVPRSSFCDLADLSGGEVNADKKESTLTLYGADASESYIAKIRFDSNGVRSRSVSSRALPNRPLQETVYHVVVDAE